MGGAFDELHQGIGAGLLERGERDREMSVSVRVRLKVRVRVRVGERENESESESQGQSKSETKNSIFRRNPGLGPRAIRRL